MRLVGALLVVGCYDPAITVAVTDAPGVSDARPPDATSPDGRPPCAVTLGPPAGDDFADDAIPAGTDLYMDGGTGGAESGQLAFSVPALWGGAIAGMNTSNAFDATGLAFVVQIVDRPEAAEAYFDIYATTADDWMGFDQLGGTLRIGQPSSFVSFDPVPAEEWWRFRVEPSETHYDVSSDGISWRALISISTPTWVADSRLDLGAYTYAALGAADSVAFDNLNLPPPCPP